MAPLLGYWKMRSADVAYYCCQCIRLILSYVEGQYDEQVYNFGPAPSFNEAEWLRDKYSLGLDFPELPYYIDEDVKMTGNGSIIHHLARKNNLYGNSDAELTRAQILEHHLCGLNGKWLRLCYSKDFESEKVAYLGELDKEVMLMSAFLRNRKFFAGENVTYVDFLAYECLSEHLLLQPGLLDNFENLLEFQKSIEALPRVGEFIKTSPSFKYPIHKPNASFGNMELQ